MKSAKADVVPSEELIGEGIITPAIFREMMRNAGAEIIARRDWSSELDGVIGDGDHGVTMEIGWKAVLAALGTTEETEPSRQVASAWPRHF